MTPQSLEGQEAQRSPAEMHLPYLAVLCCAGLLYSWAEYTSSPRTGLLRMQSRALLEYSKEPWRDLDPPFDECGECSADTG